MLLKSSELPRSSQTLVSQLSCRYADIISDVYYEKRHFAPTKLDTFKGFFTQWADLLYINNFGA